MKIIKIFIFYFLISNLSYGQKLSVGIGSGYGFAAFPAKIYGADYLGEPAEAYGSFGKGFNMVVNVEYLFMKHFSGLIAFGYHSGSAFTSEKGYYLDDVETDPSTGNFWADVHYSNGETKWNHIAQYQLTPELKISTLGKIKCYLQIGFVVGLGGKMNESLSANDSIYHLNYNYMTTYSYNENIEKVVRYSKGNTFGFTSGLGIEFSLYKNLHLFLEASLVKMEWSDANIETTETINTITTTTHGTSNFNDKPYSSINSLVGVKWIFGKIMNKETHIEPSVE